MKSKMKLAIPLAALICTAPALTGGANAQPNIQQGNANNPANLQIGGPGGGPGGRGGFGGPGGGGQGGFGGMDMTPEEQQQFMAQMRENRLRRQLAAANADQKTQDAIVLYSRAQDEAGQKLQDLMRQLVEAVSTKGTPDEKIAGLLKQLDDATAAEKARRQKARTDLDAKVGYTKLPRLNVLLTSIGLVGDEVLLLSTTQGNATANMGGRGQGGFGGPGGGGGFGAPGGGGPGGGFGGPGGPGGFGGPQGQ